MLFLNIKILKYLLHGSVCWRRCKINHLICFLHGRRWFNMLWTKVLLGGVVRMWGVRLTKSFSSWQYWPLQVRGIIFGQRRFSSTKVHKFYFIYINSSFVFFLRITSTYETKDYFNLIMKVQLRFQLIS